MGESENREEVTAALHSEDREFLRAALLFSGIVTFAWLLLSALIVAAGG